MTGETPDSRYEAALAGRDLADVRPLYRELLLELREADADAYRKAVERYEARVKPLLEEADDPLPAWFDYGRDLARRLAPGRVVAVDGSGRARELEPTGEAEATTAGPDEGRLPAGKVPAGVLLLHLPDDEGRPALALALPRQPTPAQEAARELLCG